MDTSGWTPHALSLLLNVASRLPYAEAATVLEGFGLAISAAELTRVTDPYAAACREQVKEVLEAQAYEPLATAVQRSGRIMVLQTDGVMVLGKPGQQPDTDALSEEDPVAVSQPAASTTKPKRCPGMEIKSVVLYPQASPSERYMVADIRQAQDLLPQMAGLLRLAGVTQQDTLIGLGDGAAWISQSFAQLGAIAITDVYHSSTYLDELMKVMRWSEGKRAEHRRDWLRGDIRARDWLSRYLPHDPELWFSWPQEAQRALRYLESRLDSMDYPDYLAKGYPIGSGQVEGMNKSVIGNRLKRSGMQWSQSGAASMASLRAQTCAKHSLIDFDSLRHQAYPALQS